MQQTQTWKALAGVWIILIVTQAKEQFYYDNGTIGTAINYPITHEKSVSPPYDLSSSSPVALTSSPTRNSITVKSYHVNRSWKARNQIYSDTSETINPSREKQTVKSLSIDGNIENSKLDKTEATWSEERLKVLLNPLVNRLKRIDTTSPRTTGINAEMTTIKTNFIATSTDIPSAHASASAKCSSETHSDALIRMNGNGLESPSYGIAESDSEVKSDKDKNRAGNNNEFEDARDKDVAETENRTGSEKSSPGTSRVHKSALLSGLKSDKSGDQMKPTGDLSLGARNNAFQNQFSNTSNTLENSKELENEHQEQKYGGKVPLNLFGKLLRDKPPTSSANEKSRVNYLESEAKPFVTREPFLLMPWDATIWKVRDKNTPITSVSEKHPAISATTSPNYFPNSTAGDDVPLIDRNYDPSRLLAAYRTPAANDTNGTLSSASEINGETVGSGSAEQIFITGGVAGRREIDSPSVAKNPFDWGIVNVDTVSSVRGEFVGFKYKKSKNLTNAFVDKTMPGETLRIGNNKERILLPNIREAVGVTEEKQLPEAKWNSGTPLSEVFSPDLLNSSSESQTRPQNSLPGNKATSTEPATQQTLQITATRAESTDGYPSHNDAAGAFRTVPSDPGHYGENVTSNEYRLPGSPSEDSPKSQPGGNEEDLEKVSSSKWTESDRGGGRAYASITGTFSTDSSPSVEPFSRAPAKVGGNQHPRGNETNVGVIRGTQAAMGELQFPKIKSNGNQSLVAVNQWPVKHSVIVEGDLVLGGLMMVHEREDTITCGPVMPQGGVQALEAMLFTLDWLSKQRFIPGVKIGAHILDDCDKDTYGLEMAVDFIKDAENSLVIDASSYHSRSGGKKS